jgi:hypothetical protein
MCPGDHDASKDKWPDCLTLALWYANDSDTGNVDSPVGFVVLVIQEKAEYLDSDDCPLVIPADTYMTIRENDQGHISVTQYDTAQAAQDAFDQAVADYDAYMWAEDCRDLDIIASTGRIY